MTTTIHTPPGSSSGGVGRPRELPPEWAIETLIKKIGRIPAAAGRALDRAAKIPYFGWVVRRFSSVWLGITLLTLIGLYIAIGSGMPEIRAKMEMTDLQFFDAMPMRILLAMLATDLIIVTLRRIPLTLFKLGSWTVHTGILTLITGCVWYFSMKEEGAARMYLNRPVSAWYDVATRALYAFPVKADGTFDTDHPTITPLPTLPYYYEHVAEAPYSNPLNISLSGAIQAGGPVDATIVGYYPFASLHTVGYREPQGEEPAKGPAVSITLTTTRDSMKDMWLQSDSPLNRSFELNRPFTMEFLNRPDAQRVRDLQLSLEGRAAVTVRVPKLKAEKTIVLTVEMIEKQTPIPIEGTPYTVIIEDGGDIPMRSKGYEGTHSTNLMIAVSRKDGDKTFDFKRMSLSRYPERSPDFVMENGKQVRKQDGVDPDVDIIFHDASRTNAWIIETQESLGAPPKLQVIVRTTEGKSTTTDLTDKPIDVPVDGIPGLKMMLTKHLERSVAIQGPQIIPVEQRPKALTPLDIMRFSAVEMVINGPSGPIQSVYVPFAHYAAVDDPDGTVPTIVYIPGRGLVGLLLSTVRRELPTTVTLTDFKPVKFPGAIRSYMDYVSTLKFDDGSKQPFSQVSHLNRPVYDKGLIYFQSQWDGDDNAPPEKRFSVMGIANRPGMWVMIIGSVLMALGIGYAFYVKPLLLKYKKESLAAWNAARNPPPAPARHG